MKKLCVLITILLMCSEIKSQQDAQYNLYQFNQMVINPAYAGSKDGLSSVAAVRQQWAGFDGAPRTACMSLHGPISLKNIGLGLTVVNDQMGPRNVLSIYGNVAYIIKINSKSSLSFGLNGGYNRYQFRFNKITFESTEAIPAEFASIQNKGTLDINSGLYFKADGFFAGLSATHINTPKVYNYKASAGNGKYSYQLSTHLFFTVGKSIIVNDNLVFAPTIMIKHAISPVGIDMNLNTGADVNLNFFLFKKIWLGAFYRNTFGPGALIQYYVLNNFRVAYSYDTGLNDARRLGASHEVMIGYDFIRKSDKKAVSPRFL
jgi:type IX secretion system PorP/SprF family membrane protein